MAVEPFAFALISSEEVTILPTTLTINRKKGADVTVCTAWAVTKKQNSTASTLVLSRTPTLDAPEGKLAKS